MGRSQGKGRKKSWGKADVQTVVEEARKLSNDETSQSGDLFFVDTVGNLNSKRNKKRKEEITQTKAGLQPEAPKQKPKKLKKKGVEKKDGVAGVAESATSTSVVPSTVTSTITTTTTVTETTAKATAIATTPLVDIWSAGTTPRRPPKPVRNGVKAIVAKHIPLAAHAHSGGAANPEPTEHAKLLEKAREVDAFEEAQRMVMVNYIRKIRPPKSDSDHPPNANGNTGEGEDEEEGGEEEAQGAADVPAPKKTKTLTKAERNKQQRVKKRKEDERKQQMVKKQSKQINALGRLVKEISEEEKLLQQRKAEEEEAKKNPNKEPRLGKYAAEPVFPDLPLTEDVENTKGSLRLMKVSKNVVAEQFKRFSSQRLIEPRKKLKAAGPARVRSYTLNKDWDKWTNI